MTNKSVDFRSRSVTAYGSNFVERTVAGYTEIASNFVRAHYTVNICRIQYDSDNNIDMTTMRTNIDDKWLAVFQSICDITSNYRSIKKALSMLVTGLESWNAYVIRIEVLPRRTISSQYVRNLNADY